MPRPIKYIEHGCLYFVTSRTEEGILFPVTESFRDLVNGIVARGQFLYPVEIVSLKLLGNHIHSLLVAIDPEHLPKFVGYVKQEIAHNVNRILGRRKRTVWCEGYDSPVLLGADEALDYLTYIFTQEQSAGQVDRAEEYPGVSTWKMFVSDTTVETFDRVWRSLKDNPLKLEIKHSLTVDPYAWCKFVAPNTSRDEIKAEVIARVRAREDELIEDRKRTGRSVVGRRRLAAQKRNLSYVPTKFGRRTVCICRDISVRKHFIARYNYLKSQARLVLAAWRRGDVRVPWPSGLFAPALPRLSNTIPAIAMNI